MKKLGYKNIFSLSCVFFISESECIRKNFMEIFVFWSEKGPSGLSDNNTNILIIFWFCVFWPSGFKETQRYSGEIHTILVVHHLWSESRLEIFVTENWKTRLDNDPKCSWFINWITIGLRLKILMIQDMDHDSIKVEYDRDLTFGSRFDRDSR